MSTLDEIKARDAASINRYNIDHAHIHRDWPPGHMDMVTYAEHLAALAERDTRIEELEAVLKSHNDDCQTRCGVGEQEGVACGYRPYFPRRCPTCPMHDVIEVPSSGDTKP